MEIGGRWLVKQAMKKLGIEKILSECGMTKAETDIAQMLLTAKAIHPSSELESEQWLNENSATKELYKTNENISRYKLYKAATQLYNNKKFIDKQLYENLNNMFSIVSFVDNKPDDCNQAMNIELLYCDFLFVLLLLLLGTKLFS